jgi:hypothetical protein
MKKWTAPLVIRSRFEDKGSRFRVQRFRVQGSKVQGSRFKGSGFKVQGSTFRVEKPPNNIYKRESVFIVFINPLHPIGYVDIADLGLYGKQCPPGATFEPS